MPGSEDFQRLAEELREIGAALAQAAGDADLTRWLVNAVQAAADKPAWWAREALEAEAAAIVDAAIRRARAGA